MNLFEAIFLGTVQGLTEFLPISSDGHLVLWSHFIKLANPLNYAIFLHLGTLFSVSFYFRSKIFKLIKDSFRSIKNKQKLPNILIQIIIASIPVIILGTLISSLVEKIFTNLWITGAGFFITSFMLWKASKQKDLDKEEEQISKKDSFLTGLMQTIAILPGVSRSGSTISMLLIRKVKREVAFEFSFLLSIPAIIGAVILELCQGKRAMNGEEIFYLLGFLAAFGSGLIALNLLKKIFYKNKLNYFAFYTLIMGILSFGLAL